MTFYGQTRVFMRMSSDGILADRLGQVSQRFETPTAATVVCAIAARPCAALLPIDVLGDLVSMGTLLSFTNRLLGSARPTAGPAPTSSARFG